MDDHDRASLLAQKDADRILDTILSGADINRVIESMAENHESWLLASEFGSPSAAWLLGLLHLGQGEEGSRPDRAQTYFRRAIGHQHAPSMTSLGALFWTGSGVPCDKETAASWWKRAAELGDPEAQS